LPLLLRAIRVAEATPDDDAADVLRTLLLPFEEALVPRMEGMRVLMLNARASPALPAQAHAWRLQQDFRPHADALARAGFESTPELPSGEFDAVLLPAPRQRQHGRALLVEGFARLSPGGVLVACAANDGGGRSLQRDLEALAGPTHALSKHRCRASWAVREGAGNTELARQWLEQDAPVALPGTQLRSRPGVFAWDRIDAASALLASRLPFDLHGRGADLGSGHGYLAAEVLARNPGIRALELYEASARALALSQENLRAAGDVELGFHWHDVAAGLPRADYDFIVSNPPFHEGRADRPELGRAFIAAAAAALRAGGRFYMVANRHLPYEAALAQAFAQVRTLADEGGFKVIEAVRA
jgi:16S rRNA (guanine1207-N2)-methyltransferase